MKILMVSSEAHPWAKTGGLADAVSGLIAALNRAGHQVSVLLPRYYGIDRSGLDDTGVAIAVQHGNEESVMRLHRSVRGGVEWIFADCEALFGRDGIYGYVPAEPFADNARRFAAFSALAAEYAARTEPDVLHAHDWTVALSAAVLRDRHPETSVATVFTIHNLGYQGTFSSDWLETMPLNPVLAEKTRLLEFGHLNFLRCGIATFDQISTVSPQYAREIQTPRFGFQLDGMLRERADQLTGILNGVDYDEWDPRRDPHLPLPFSAEDPRPRALIAEQLRAELGLPNRPETPLIGMVTRLVDQKGVADLVAPSHGSLPEILERMDVQFAILGTGQPIFEKELVRIATQRDDLAVVTRFDEGFAHRIEAGSDFFLMPSRYEPSGLNQLYSLRYGSIPIVTPTGGLLDSVVDIDRNPSEATGLYIPEPLNPQSIVAAVERALQIWKDPQLVAAMRARGMAADFSWDNAVPAYVSLYQRAKASVPVAAAGV